VKLETTTPDKPKSRDTEAFLAAARERFAIAQEAETQRRIEALDDLRFRGRRAVA
jgi:hypothetical protein